MFGNCEEVRLQRIRRQLQADDPAFVADFERSLRLLQRSDFRRPKEKDVAMRSRVWIVVMIATIVLGLLQLADGVVGGAAFMGVIAIGAYLACRYDLPRAWQG